MRPKVPLFQPFRHRRFRDLSIANFVSNLGTWMQTFAAMWLVASVSATPSTTAWVQAAMNAPIFLFAIPGGVLADRIDTPKYLFWVHLQMACCALALAAYVCAQGRAPWMIIALTFLVGVGAALRVSAWQSSMSGLVEPEEIASAATVNGLSFNLASVIGPALGGLAFASVGPATLFLANALSFVALLVLYRQWWKSDHEQVTPRSDLATSLKEGLAAAWRSSRFRAVVTSSALFLFGTTALPALLPLFVRDVLHLQSTTYGSLMGALGAGAVAGAFVLPSLRARLSQAAIVCAAVAVYGLVLLSLNLEASLAFAMAAIAIAGAAWAAILSSLNAAAQSEFTMAVRARALSTYFVSNAASLAAGSILWGYAANHLGAARALGAAGIYLCVISAIAYAARSMAPSKPARSSPEAAAKV